jgi:hypothetical protein
VNELLQVRQHQNGRRETELERADRNLNELLQELRVIGTGVQVLFGFLLILPFNNRFAHMGTLGHLAYFAILVVTACAAGLLLAPTPLHRLVFRQGEKPYLVEASNRLAILGIVFLMLALTGILAFISGYLFGGVAAAVVGAGAAAFFGGCWFGLGLRRRAKIRGS